MECILAAVGLVIAIMALSSYKIMLIIRIAFTIIIASYVYNLFYGSYTLWLTGSYWTQSNIDDYIHHTFLKSLTCIGIVAFIYYWLLVRLISYFVKKRAIKMSTNINKNHFIDVLRKHAGTMIKLGTFIYGARSTELKDGANTYKGMVTMMSNEMSFILQALTVWILIWGSSFWFIIAFIVISVISVGTILFISFLDGDGVYKLFINIMLTEIQKQDN